MNSDFGLSRDKSAGATGAPSLPGIDYDAYRLKAARLRAQTYRQVAVALHTALVNVVQRAIRAVMPFTDHTRETCDTTIVSRSFPPDLQSPLAVYLPQLLRANDNGVVSRKSESA